MVRKRRPLPKTSRVPKREHVLRAPSTPDEKQALILAHARERGARLHHHLRARSWGMMAAAVCVIFILVGWLLTVKIQIREAKADASVSLWSIARDRVSSWRAQAEPPPID